MARLAPIGSRPTSTSMRTLETRHAVGSSMRSLAALMFSLMVLTTTLLAFALADSRDVRPATSANGAAVHDRPLDVGR